ncbi:MAG: methyltransferase domain-containing protein [Actinomycetota bacterium]|nr:methyltransferase domain-containing protein [Actinomycetota bacterium]MDQ2980768.1 methyltransferase domain-containing protein [Actinomycetota bacterium]
MTSADSGVNVVGFFKAEFGQGEAARRVVTALDRAGLPVRTITYDRIPHRQDHPFEERSANDFYPTNIVCLNAEHLLSFTRGEGRELLRGRYSVGLWFWETSRFPPELRQALDYLDEVWVASLFVADAISAETAKPVLTLPLPVIVPEPSGLARADLRLAEDAFVFAYVFDFFSTIERKNPLGLVEAYKRAFSPDAGALLYLKSINGERAPEDLARLRAAAGDRADIRIEDGYVDGERLTALTELCDCYVSLHRSEGFGLTIAEAMAFGKPVIATGYSGNLAFMDEETSYLVPYTLTTLEQAVGPYPAGTVWADPDLDEAARLMREVVDDPERARERGQRGRDAIESRQSVDRAAAFLAERVPQLEGLRTERDTRDTPGTRAARFLAEGPTPSWDAPSRSGAVGRLCRRVLRRLLRPYVVRQAELETLLVSGLDELERSRDRLEDAIRALGESVRQLQSLAGELHARPYTAAAVVGGASPYAAFEDVFRGPEERVRELLEPYVELLRGHEPVLDLGCGRGELLELLSQAKIEARGVDSDEGMVERSRAKGLAVEQEDAVAYLERQPEGSLGAIIAVHVIEHLAFEELQRLLELTRRALRPGGLFVAETVNPHSVQAFKTFWVDPTHRAPIFPEVASTLALIHGFSDAEIVYPRSSGDAEADRVEQTEYALVARAPG